jgi:hypothetical protein
MSELEISRFLTDMGVIGKSKNLVITEKAPRGNMGTFSILFRIVK